MAEIEGSVSPAKTGRPRTPQRQMLSQTALTGAGACWLILSKKRAVWESPVAADGVEGPTVLSEISENRVRT